MSETAALPVWDLAQRRAKQLVGQQILRAYTPDHVPGSGHPGDYEDDDHSPEAEACRAAHARRLAW